MRGPKRAARIRKMFNLTKDDDVRHYVKIYGKKVRPQGLACAHAPGREAVPLWLLRASQRRGEGIVKDGC